MTPTKHLAILIALAGTLALPSSALADSIVYIKRGDVWLARGDGSGQRALTRDGTPRNSYRAPSYSNGGVITALKGERNVVFLNRRGKRLRKPRDVIGGPVPPFDPIALDTQISPNGRLLASTMLLTSQGGQPRPGAPTGSDFGTSVFYTRVSDGRILGQTRDGQYPFWLSNSRLVVWAPNVFESADAYFVSVSNPDSVTPWFQDQNPPQADFTDGEPLDDGALTRSHDKLAVVRGPNTTASSAPTSIRVYGVSSLEGRPTDRCDLRSAPNAFFQQPTWSPNGRRLAWSERSGIWASPISSGSGPDCGAAPRRLIAGGLQPAWGPANVPRRRR